MLRVCKSTRNYDQLSIVLQGAWLVKAGFAPGDYISVSCQENRLTIQIEKITPLREFTMYLAVLWSVKTTSDGGFLYSSHYALSVRLFRDKGFISDIRCLCGKCDGTGYAYIIYSKSSL